MIAGLFLFTQKSVIKIKKARWKVMAYWIQYSGTRESSYRRGYICESVNDVNDLPTQTTQGKKQEKDTVSSDVCAYGSEAYVIEDGSRYILAKTSNEWTKLKTATVSGGGSSLDILGDGGIFLTIPN